MAITLASDRSLARVKQHLSRRPSRFLQSAGGPLDGGQGVGTCGLPLVPCIVFRAVRL